MTTVERILELCHERRVPVARLERELQFSNGYLKNLQEGKLPAERLFAVAEYFGVSPEYLLTGERKTYYFNDETAEAAQEIFDDPDLRALFDAAKDCPPEVLRSTAELLRQLKKTNPDG